MEYNGLTPFAGVSKLLLHDIIFLRTFVIGIPIYSGFYSSTEMPIIGYEVYDGPLKAPNRYDFLLTSTVYEFIPEDNM